MGRSALMRRAALVAAAVAIAGCGSTAPTAYSVVDSYVNAIGEGNYSNACGLLDQTARGSLHGPCRRVFARCLPNEAKAFAHDQTQQLYANINLTTTGKTALAVVSGTAVARTLKRVSLVDRGGNWRLTAPGLAIERCHH